MNVARGKASKQGGSRSPDGDRAATAAYVAALSAELAALSRRYKLEALGYLLDIARLEAEGAAQGTRNRAAPSG